MEEDDFISLMCLFHCREQLQPKAIILKGLLNIKEFQVQMYNIKVFVVGGVHEGVAGN